MIVKDEESSLGRCLESIKDEVDDIIIVDTGSKDRTVDIARRYTAKIYHHPWENSFSRARNQALKYAQGDWVFQLDADEELSDKSKGLLRECVKNQEADAFNIGILCLLNKGKSSSFHRFPRLFRNNGSIHYDGIVHNQVVGYTRLKDSDIVILHHGYDVDPDVMIKKFKRTTALLYEQISENPNNPDPYTYLSTSYISMERYKEAFDTSHKAIELMRGQNRYTNMGSVAFYNNAVCYFHMNDFKSMVEMGLECQGNYPDDIDSCVVLVFGYRGLQEWDQVIQWGDIFSDKVQKVNRVGSRVIMSFSDMWKTHLFAGEAYMHKEDRKEAVHYFHKSLSISSERETCLSAIIKILLKQEWIKEARPFTNIALKEGICHDAVNIFKGKEGVIVQNSITTKQSHRNKQSRGIEIERPHISLCMIVKDESCCIGRCLESVHKLVDEMVIVDTGSSDNTSDIARDYGARIYQYKWDDDFSAARNYALSKAQGEWILILDADEVIAHKDINKIRDMINREEADAYRFTLRNYVRDVYPANVIANQKDYEEGLEYSGYIPSSLIRLLKADPEIRFSGSVHETLDASFDEKGGKVLDSGIPIHHYGKVMESRVSKKQQLYQRLGFDKIKRYPDDPVAYKTLADQCLEMGRYAQALEVVEKGLRLHPHFAELHFNKGLALERAGNFDEAENAYLETIKQGEHHAGAYNNLATIYFKKNRYGEAMEVLRSALRKGVNHPVIHYTLGLIYGTQKKNDEALRHYNKTLEMSPGFKKVNIQKARILLEKHKIEKAVECLQREIENKGDLLMAYVTLGEIGLHTNDMQGARDYFQKVLAIDPDNHVAATYLKRLSN
ncbi:MAG: glycosyltransferase [Thermodesulfobacteriota bacterium]|nr:glycosyltransferase [Thermodesulfobacteriota bacterium]